MSKKETLKVIFDDIDEAAERFFGRYSPEPPKDLVEVVRCEDCVNWSDDKSHHCPLVAWWNRANDYCSAGARKGATDD